MDPKTQEYMEIEKDSVHLYKLIDIFLKRKLAFILTLIFFIILSFVVVPAQKEEGFSTVMDIRALSDSVFEFAVMNSETEYLVRRTAIDSMTYWKLIGIGIEALDTSTVANLDRYMITSDKLLVAFFDYLILHEFVLNSFKNLINKESFYPFTLDDVNNFFENAKIDFVNDDNIYPGGIKKSIIKLTVKLDKFDDYQLSLLSKLIFEQISKIVMKDLLQQLEQLVESINSNVDSELKELELLRNDIIQKETAHIVDTSAASERLIELCNNAENELEQVAACRYVLDRNIQIQIGENTNRELLFDIIQTINKLKRKNNIDKFRLQLDKFKNDLDEISLLIKTDFNNMEKISDGRIIPFQYFIIIFGLLFSVFVVYLIDGYSNYKKDKV